MSKRGLIKYCFLQLSEKAKKCPNGQITLFLANSFKKGQIWLIRPLKRPNGNPAHTRAHTHTHAHTRTQAHTHAHTRTDTRTPAGPRLLLRDVFTQDPVSSMKVELCLCAEPPYLIQRSNPALSHVLQYSLGEVVERPGWSCARAAAGTGAIGAAGSGFGGAADPVGPGPLRGRAGWELAPFRAVPF